MASKCRKCSGNILRHSLRAECSICAGSMHKVCAPMSRDEHSLHVGIFMFKYIHNDLPNFFNTCSMISCLHEIYAINTRGAN